MIMTSTTFDEALEMYGIESRKAGQEEGRKEGQDLFAKLVSQLLSEGKTEELIEIAQDSDKRDEYLKLYGIIKKKRTIPTVWRNASLESTLRMAKHFSIKKNLPFRQSA